MKTHVVQPNLDGTITLPEPVVERFSLKEGDIVILEERRSDGIVELRFANINRG